jgi:hypothetical protein
VSLAELLDLDCPFPRLSLHKPQPHVPTLRTAMLVGLFQRRSFLLSRSDGDWDDLPPRQSNHLPRPPGHALKR